MTAGIRLFFFWRGLYALLDSRIVVALAAAAVRQRPGLAPKLVEQMGYSGWPGREPGWVNLHGSRFAWRVACRAAGRPRANRRPPRPDPEPLRLGIVGAFCALLSFGARQLFSSVPNGIALHVFDLEYEGSHAEYAARAGRYHPFGVTPGYVQRIAATANDLDLDLVVNFTSGEDAYALVDALETPCIAHYSTGSDLLHNERVSFTLWGQPEADYMVRGGRMFCGMTRAWFGGPPVVESEPYYDPEGIEVDARRPWEEREPIIVVHGSLFKAARRDFLSVVTGLLEADPALQLVLMGKGDEALETITRSARAAGVQARVHYEGRFSPVRASDGSYPDPGRRKLMEFLRAARLAPDPWPIGGASARVEAYGAGTPTVHMGVRFDRAVWGKPQPALIDVSALRVAEATAYTMEDYAALCRRCLYHGAFADRVAGTQTDVFRRVTDASRFWRQITNIYRAWLADPARFGDRRAVSASRVS